MEWQDKVNSDRLSEDGGSDQKELMTQSWKSPRLVYPCPLYPILYCVISIKTNVTASRTFSSSGQMLSCCEYVHHQTKKIHGNKATIVQRTIAMVEIWRWLELFYNGFYLVLLMSLCAPSYHVAFPFFVSIVTVHTHQLQTCDTTKYTSTMTLLCRN